MLDGQTGIKWCVRLLACSCSSKCPMRQGQGAVGPTARH